MPVNQSPLGALPARFRRPRLLIVGCGDVGLRVVQVVPRGGARCLALTSSADRIPELRQRGVIPVLGNLDQPRTLQRLAGLATHVLHLAPPPGEGEADPRTRALWRALRRRNLPKALVYGSTTGVYGDCQGAWVTEARALNARTPRARRRVDAERTVRLAGRQTAMRVSILRIPGIYANDRAGGTPRERLLKGAPVLEAVDDVYTNHIHAADLARACLLAVWRGAVQRVYHVSDDTDLKMGDYFDLAADLYGLLRPPRVTRQQAQAQLPALQLSFMSESRRLDNRRMTCELGLRLRYPTVAQGLTGG